jgi:hypothetical protein
MKLSELIPHTSNWTGVPVTHVNTVARALRPADLISSAGNNPRGAEMTVDDKINLLLGVCGVEIANRAAEHVRVWRRLVRHSDHRDHRFAFLSANTVRDFFYDLITKDLNGGPLDAWLREADDAYDQIQGAKAARRHEITLDFFIDEFEFTILVSRFIGGLDVEKFPSVRQSSADIIEVTFRQPAPGKKHEYRPSQRDDGFAAGSKLIRRLNAKNIRGWGQCLVDATEDMTS